MERITNEDLANMLARYVRALDKLGISLGEGERIGLDHGSKTYGVAFRLFTTGGALGTGHHRPPVGDDFLGMTKREAWETLATLARAMEDVAYATVPGRGRRVDA